MTPQKEKTKTLPFESLEEARNKGLSFRWIKKATKEKLQETNQKEQREIVSDTKDNLEALKKKISLQLIEQLNSEWWLKIERWWDWLSYINSLTINGNRIRWYGDADNIKIWDVIRIKDWKVLRKRKSKQEIEIGEVVKWFENLKSKLNKIEELIDNEKFDDAINNLEEIIKNVWKKYEKYEVLLKLKEVITTYSKSIKNIKDKQKQQIKKNIKEIIKKITENPKENNNENNKDKQVQMLILMLLGMLKQKP